MADARLHWIAQFTITEGNLEAFKQAAEEIIAAVEPSEPGALMYEWFYSEDGTTCHVDEWYADTEAALAHLTGEAPKLIPNLLELSKLTGLYVYGDVTNRELRDLLTSFGAVFTSNLGGFTRT